MPMNRAGAGRLAMKPVNESRIAQINGNMLIASSRAIVGRMKSQAIDRSDRPRTRLAIGAAVRMAMLSISVGVTFVPFIRPLGRHQVSPGRSAPRERLGFRRGEPRARLRRIFAFLFEDFLPVLDQRVERLLGCAFVSDNVV